MISGGRMGSASTLHLAFDNHVHQLDAAQKDSGTAKSLESQHGSRSSLDRPMVLPDQIVEIFRLADPDGRFAIGIDRFERGELAPLLSMVTVSGAPFQAIDFSK
ncbi:hypothetical protein QFZ39_001122 [Paraburkholderia graminis]|nr:hypothetical protein [Paraburkholderia graminis]